MKEVVLAHSTVAYRAPIIYITCVPDADLGFGEIRELINTAEELSGKQPYFVLTDVRAGVSVTPMGKKTSADPASAPLHRGTAVVVRNSMIELAANFFGTLKKQPFPFKAFTEIQEAEEWLLTLSLEKGAS